MTDLKIDPQDLLKNQDTDALKWAKSFMQTVQENNLEVDEGLMLAWFASAIMTMHDYVHNNPYRALKHKRN